MRIVAFNGSPRAAEGNTEVLLQAFLAGARAEGAETEVNYLATKDIAHCTGCFSCWTKTPGECVHRDDMPDLLLRVRSADVAVLAFPLYGNMVPGLMKDFIDRTFPLGHPAIKKIAGQYVHPARYADGKLRSVVISNAGFPETHHFDGLKATFRQSGDNPHAELLGMICCAGGPLLRTPDAAGKIRWYLDATQDAGREVVRNGRITPTTQAILDRSLASDPGEYAGWVNDYWRREGVVMPDEEEGAGYRVSSDPGQSLVDRGESTVRDLLARLASAFSADRGGDLRATIQFEVSDEKPGLYFLAIGSGRCSAHEGRASTADLTIRTPADVWLKVCAGELDGAAAFVSGQYQVVGDTALLMRFGTLFGGA
ncbi:MAG: NAD(P)H-dependent oxidoreductase [Candidatus Bipolaricaulis sp.]|nr:NAD(P)H-dependent oxidoreductase [Candidatus Bipolaricaulis sp.]